MHPESYTKFYVLTVLALVLGFIGMEVGTLGLSLGEGDLTGLATDTIDGTQSLTGGATPGSNLLFLLVGVFAGAALVGTAVYIYSLEKRRIE